MGLVPAAFSWHGQTLWIFSQQDLSCCCVLAGIRLAFLSSAIRKNDYAKIVVEGITATEGGTQLQMAVVGLTVLISNEQLIILFYILYRLFTKWTNPNV